MDFRFQKHFKGPRGENGRSKSQHGKNAKETVVKVPPGTIIYDKETDVVIADLTEHGQQAVIARGGRGGRGNCRFATPKNPAPHLAENGEPGEEKEIRMELKLLADAGLVGFPSVGKSTLLSVVSAAKPKVASYHFTTIKPNLGVVSVDETRGFVLADLPGLIEGASQGAGLGHQFLRHIERTRVIIHVIDMAGSEGRDPFEDYQLINHELEAYQFRLLERPQVIAANKMDMPGAEESLEKFKEQLSDDISIFPISAVTQEGISGLLNKVYSLIEETPLFPLFDEPEEEDQTEHKVFRMEAEEKPFYITRESNGTYVINGKKVEKLFKMTDFNHDESARRFARQLRSMGVDDELRGKGIEEGDIVRVLDYEFEFME